MLVYLFDLWWVDLGTIGWRFYYIASSGVWLIVCPQFECALVVASLALSLYCVSRVRNIFPSTLCIALLRVCDLPRCLGPSNMGPCSSNTRMTDLHLRLPYACKSLPCLLLVNLPISLCPGQHHSERPASRFSFAGFDWASLLFGPPSKE